MVWEGEGFLRHVLSQNLPISNFIDSDFLLLNERLATHYGVEGVKGLALQPVPRPADSVRGGVLTQAGVLKVTANGTATSPVLRGVWVLENILGQPTPPPPPNTGGIEPDIRGATTVREQLAKHRDNESCQSCHRSIDPPGFALESFDPIGTYRTQYARFVVTNEEKGWGHLGTGAKVDASGETSAGERFADIREFKRLLLNEEKTFAECLARKLLTYGMGRELGFSDRASVAAILEKTRAEGSGLRTLLYHIVASDTFSTR
jgi:hypothetical protein